MAGWNVGVSGLGSCLMSRLVIVRVAWSMICCRVRGVNAAVNSQNIVTEAQGLGVVRWKLVISGPYANLHYHTSGAVH